MNNYENMNGYEFEEFVQKVLEQLEFTTLITKKSNDGGIDIIAYHSKPFFKGKYLIQCKHYTNTNVGQPEIRDLYGTVMKERAVKGVLITTSSFTPQALEFANEVGIECIAGDVLNNIVQGLNVYNERETIFTAKSSSPEYKKCEKYNLLYRKIDIESSNITHISNMIFYLFSIIGEDTKNDLFLGLLNELQYYCEIFKKKANKKNPELVSIKSISLSLEILSGDIFRAYCSMADYVKFQRRNPIMICSNAFFNVPANLSDFNIVNFVVFIQNFGVDNLDFMLFNKDYLADFLPNYFENCLISSDTIAQCLKETEEFFNTLHPKCFNFKNSYISCDYIFNQLKFKNETIIRDIEKIKILIS